MCVQEGWFSTRERRGVAQDEAHRVAAPGCEEQPQSCQDPRVSREDRAGAHPGRAGTLPREAGAKARRRKGRSCAPPVPRRSGWGACGSPRPRLPACPRSPWSTRRRGGRGKHPADEPRLHVRPTPPWTSRDLERQPRGIAIVRLARKASALVRPNAGSAVDEGEDHAGEEEEKALVEESGGAQARGRRGHRPGHDEPGGDHRRHVEGDREPPSRRREMAPVTSGRSGLLRRSFSRS